MHRYRARCVSSNNSEEKTMAEKGYQRFAKLLRDYGVKYVFLQDAIFRKGMHEAERYGVRGILTHSEGAAGCMADGYARARRAILVRPKGQRG